jgi:uncharacterized membrane protein
MTTTDTERPSTEPDKLPRVRQISMDAPWDWLAAGWRDVWSSNSTSLVYGLAFAVISSAFALTITALNLSSLILALASGLILIGPILAVGLYDISRRLEAGEPVRLKQIFRVRTRAPAQLMFLGVILMIAFLVWVRVATLLFALFFGLHGFPPLAQFVDELFFTARGLALLTVGSAIGAVLALIVFAISAVSVPLLMVRNVDAVTAMLLSIEAVRKNLGPMILWAWLIMLMMGFGLVTLFAGLVITFPLVGHATWHAFRAIIDTDGDDPEDYSI